MTQAEGAPIAQVKIIRKGKPQLKGMAFTLLLFILPVLKAWPSNEAITVPLIVGDYYAWAYTEAFVDRSYIYGFSTAGVDLLGWGLLVGANDYDAGLKLVNLAGLSKTLYPVVALLGAKDEGIRQRAWIALGTHAFTLITLEVLGRPALSVQAMGPQKNTYGLTVAWRY